MSAPPPTARGRMVVGTRGSDLALAQATLTEAALAAAHPTLHVTREIIKTAGDNRPDLRFAEFSAGPEPVADKGIFTKELEAALAEGTIDIAVHSLKDVPTELGPGYAIAAVLPRAPTEDVLVSKHEGGFHGLPAGAAVATGSVRRQALIAHLRPDLKVVEIRGNVPTRIGKLARDDGLDAIVLARAGLVRLGMMGPDAQAAVLRRDRAVLTATVLDPDRFVPAAGQGAVAIETFRAGPPLLALLAAIDHPNTHTRARAERHFLHLLEAGCQTPVGVQTAVEDGTLRFRALVFHEDALHRAPEATSAEGSSDDPESVAAAAFQKLGRTPGPAGT